MLNRVVINGIDVTDYKNHPRILELRFISTYDRWHREFGDRADNLLTGLANAFNCDITKLRVVANQSPAIRKILKSDRQRLVQELIFMGEVWKETRYKVGNKYLNLTKRTLYGQKEYIPSQFVTEKWISQLDSEIVSCGLKQYAVEVERFLESVDALERAI